MIKIEKIDYYSSLVFRLLSGLPYMFIIPYYFISKINLDMNCSSLGDQFMYFSPPGFPGRRRMGRINHGGGPSPPPMGGG